MFHDLDFVSSNGEINFSLGQKTNCVVDVWLAGTVVREFKQPRRRRQQERHKFAYLTMKNNTFARFARAFFIFGHLADVLDLSTT